MITNKTIELPETEIARFNDACNQIVPEFSEMRDGSKIFDHEVKFDDGMMMAVQVITCRDDTCYTQGVLFDEGCESGCTDTQYSLSGEFTVGDYTVHIAEQAA